LSNSFLHIDVFDASVSFEKRALAVFKFQYKNCEVYHQYVDALKINVAAIDRIEKIPFLPIRFFKSHRVIIKNVLPQIIFKSSGTTGAVQSQHFIAYTFIYEQSMQQCFNAAFGNIDEYCFLALLPSYLEKNNSSLVYMVQQMMQISKHPCNGFYLYNHDELNATILNLESTKQKTILIGVTYALLDFADKYKPNLNHTIVVETGGMKGRRAEWLKFEVHDYLKQSFATHSIASEYGMTELLSQFYATKQGIFNMQNTAQVLIRDMYDPFQITNAINASGCINVVDLANINSCSFIATDDIGKIKPNNTFEIIGRADYSDVRGCNLMIN
jgi:phenylacetate-coenzyme A ligase PaaK-like adenylate-forming protein